MVLTRPRHAQIQRGGGIESEQPLEYRKATVLFSNTGPDPMDNS